MQPRIEYLGHILDENGRHPTAEKVQAIQDAPTPKDVTQFRSFLGILTYYCSQSNLTPLYSLLGKNKRWVWGAEQDKAFQQAK